MCARALSCALRVRGRACAATTAQSFVIASALLYTNFHELSMSSSAGARLI